MGGGGIGVKTSTHISVMDRGFALDTLRKKRGDSSISLDSDERQLNTVYLGSGGGATMGMGGMGGISTETTVEVEEQSMRHVDGALHSDLESGVGSLGWRHDMDDGGYSVRIEAGGDEKHHHPQPHFQPQQQQQQRHKQQQSISVVGGGGVGSKPSRSPAASSPPSSPPLPPHSSSSPHPLPTRASITGSPPTSVTGGSPFADGNGVSIAK